MACFGFCVRLLVCLAAHRVADFFQLPLRQEPFVELMKSSLQTFLNVTWFEHPPPMGGGEERTGRIALNFVPQEAMTIIHSCEDVEHVVFSVGFLGFAMATMAVPAIAQAMTFPDRTCYPVASCNLKDFYNLIDVGSPEGVHQVSPDGEPPP